MSRRGNGLGFFAGLDEFLGVLVCDSFLMVGSHLSLLLIVRILRIFEDIDEMFTLY
jgi:hypothetical protein